MEPESIVRFSGVSLGYGRTPVLSAVDLTLKTGDFFGLVGPNGAGKTTLLLGLIGLLPVQGGQATRQSGIRFGYVPQRQNLDDIFPLTVADVIQMADIFTPGSSIKLHQVLETVGLSGRARDFYRDLSGGQRQRVLLARALAVDPDVLVLDEPTTGLDFPSEAGFMDLVDRFNARGRTVIMVTHALNLVANHARSLGLVAGGKMVTGSAEELLTRESLSRLYDRGIEVVSIGGRKVLVADAPVDPGEASAGETSAGEASAGEASP